MQQHLLSILKPTFAMSAYVPHMTYTAQDICTHMARICQRAELMATAGYVHVAEVVVGLFPATAFGFATRIVSRCHYPRDGPEDFDVHHRDLGACVSALLPPSPTHSTSHTHHRLYAHASVVARSELRHLVEEQHLFLFSRAQAQS